MGQVPAGINPIVHFFELITCNSLFLYPLSPETTYRLYYISATPIKTLTNSVIAEISNSKGYLCCLFSLNVLFRQVHTKNTLLWRPLVNIFWKHLTSPWPQDKQSHTYLWRPSPTSLYNLSIKAIVSPNF